MNWRGWLGTDSPFLAVLIAIYYLAWLAVLAFIGYLAFEAMRLGL